jgi:hypothetical protein
MEALKQKLKQLYQSMRKKSVNYRLNTVPNLINCSRHPYRKFKKGSKGLLTRIKV